MYNVATDIIPQGRSSAFDRDANERQVHMILDNLYLYQGQIKHLQAGAVPKRIAAIAGGSATYATQLDLLLTDVTNAISRIRAIDAIA